MGRLGRKPKLTPIIQEAIVRVLRTGATRTMAARYVEVHPDTFFAWMQRYPSFRLAVEKAEADCDIALVSRIRAASSAARLRAMSISRVLSAWWVSQSSPSSTFSMASLTFRRAP